MGHQRLLRDREDRPSLCSKQDGELLEARRRGGMLGAEYLLADRQRALERRVLASKRAATAVGRGFGLGGPSIHATACQDLVII
jgi:hypothetical protein